MLNSSSSHRHLVTAIKIGLALILFTPLILLQNFYFPFIVPRNLFFRLIIDIVFSLCLYLSIVDINFRPRFNKGFILFFLFVISLTISSILGGHFAYSFWSNFERMDGLVNWLHIILYVIVLLGIFKNKEQWYGFFKISLFSAIITALIALGQRLGWSFVMASTGGVRLTALMGNAAYVASYLMLHSFLAIYLLKVEWRKVIWRYFYIGSLILFIFILISTQTRGAFLGLLVFAVLFVLGYLLVQRKDRNKFYYGALILLIAIFTFVTLLFTQKQATWVKDVSLFSKISNISLSDTTAQSRLMIWRNSLEGVKEKPIFGWGEENFIYVFNKYFPIEIFHDTGSEVWFDRPHNILVQHLVQGGIVGFILYLSVFFYLIYLYLILAFLWQENANISLDKFFNLFTKYKYFIGLSLSTIFLILSVYFFYFSSLSSNLSLIKFLSYSYNAKTTADLSMALDSWDRSFNASYLGIKEKTENLQKVTLALVQNQSVDTKVKTEFFNKTALVLEDIVNKYPDDVRMAFFLVDFYSTFQTYQPEFVEKNIVLLEHLHQLAPQRPDTLLRLTSAYLANNKVDKAIIVAQQLVDLAPWAKAVYWNNFRVAVTAKDLVGVDFSLQNIVVLNQKNNQVDFLDTEITQLNNFVNSLPATETILKETLNKYLVK